MAKKKYTPEMTRQDEKLEETPLLDTLTINGHFSEAISSLVQEKFSTVFGRRNLKPIHEHLKVEGKKVNEGNLESAERMLITQAHTLNTIFNCLALRASGHDEVELFESLMRLAFKAQSQCRTTLETLGNIKNPTQMAFVKQANIGYNQQVNNNISPELASRAGEIKNQQTQLLEGNHVEWLDVGAKSPTINTDKELATMGKIDGAKNKGR